jgi:hypothetical protein
MKVSIVLGWYCHGIVYTCVTSDVHETSGGFPSKPSQSSEGRDLCEAQVDIPLSVSHSCVDRIAGLFNRHRNSNWGIC